MHRLARISTRWLGVGLAAGLSAVTIGLAMTGQLDLFINPDSNWFAISMGVLALVGTALSFLLPLGAEDDHGHDHGDGGGHATASGRAATESRMTVAERRDAPPRAEYRAAVALAAERANATAPVVARRGDVDLLGATHDHDHAHDHAHDLDHAHVSEAEYAHAHPRRGFWSLAAVVVGGVVASAVVVAALVLPPRSLSAELAMSRDLGSPPLFGGEDVVQLATTGDLSKFGIGQWSTVFQTAPDPRAFDGTDIKLTGFVAPSTDGDPDAMRLTRLVITHCVIDAQPATLPVESAKWENSYKTGQWVTIEGKVKETDDGKLVVVPDAVTAIDEPADPYEY